MAESERSRQAGAVKLGLLSALMVALVALAAVAAGTQFILVSLICVGMFFIGGFFVLALAQAMGQEI